MDLLLAIMTGVGLSAACGFRVFVPLLVTSIAANAGHLELIESMEWVASYPALIAFAVATALEVGGYYVPWVDNLLDTMATPAALVAGTVVMYGVTGEMDPFLKWALAIVAGGGAAGTVQGLTVLTRAGSTAVSGGFSNPVVSTGENAGSVAAASLAVFVPVLAVILVAVFVFFMIRALLRLRRRKAAAGAEAAEVHSERKV